MEKFGTPEYRASFRRRPRCAVPYKCEVLHYGGPGNHKSRMLDEVIKLNSPAGGHYTNNGSSRAAVPACFSRDALVRPAGGFYDFCEVLRFIFIGGVTGSRADDDKNYGDSSVYNAKGKPPFSPHPPPPSPRPLPLSPTPRKTEEERVRAFYGRLL